MKICTFKFKPKDFNLAIERLKWAIKDLDPENPLDVLLETHNEKRSLDANAYLWVLIGEIARETQKKKEEVYREEIRELGGNYDTVCATQKAVGQLCGHWEAKGLGWISERFESKIEGCENVNLYYGSSVYDTAQMARLIDNVVQDARALGIETMTPKELSLLKEAWHG